MTRLACTFVLVAWACWLGGLITLFTVLGRIFTTPGFARDEQGAFAARLFPTFERMQLAFGAVALLGTAAWWFAARARLKLVLFTLFAVATLSAVIEASMITPRVESLVADGRRGTSEFDRMHRLSTRVYLSGAVVLLVAGVFLPSAIRGDAAVTTPPRRTSEETAPA